MADVGDDADFGSQLLDSMLEVEMTEGDGEVDVSKNEDPLGALPPIPMFDLQSETLSFEDVYRNSSLVQPVISPIPIAGKTEKVASAVSVVKTNPLMGVYTRDYQSSPTVITSPLSSKTASIPTLKSNSVTIQKTSPKLVARTDKVIIKNVQLNDQLAANQFLQQVFKAEYVKSVFTKQDTPGDLAVVSKEEMNYYKTCFKDLSKVQYCRLHCTICDKHLGCGDNVDKKLKIHSMLKVLTCTSCHEFYGDGNFPCDVGDNCEIYCRWCGQGGALVCCSFCPRVFCKKCVKRNFGPTFLRLIQKASDWACFCCAQKPLWPHRAICRALIAYVAQRKTEGKMHKDTTRCCGTLIGRKKLMPKPPQGQLKVGIPNTNSLATPNKLILPKSVPGKESTLLKRNLQPRLNSLQKPQRSSVQIVNKNASSNTQGRSLISGSSIIRGITTSAPNKILSSLSHPQLIKGPVLHGETTITPPSSRMLLAAKPPPKPILPATASIVKAFPVNQTTNIDLNKIPTVKVPHDFQGVIMKMIFTDNNVQLVRLLTDIDGCKGATKFPMPEFKNIEDSEFLEEILSHSFKLSKMIYDNLMFVKNKMNLKNTANTEEVLGSSVEKLHFVYEKAVELIKELDSSLTECHDKWKNKTQNFVDVIDLEEEDNATKKNKLGRCSKFLEKCKELVLSDDSDIEILDEVTEEMKSTTNTGRTVNNYTKATGRRNSKENFRLRGALTEKNKSYHNDKPVGRKRKKHWRRGRKRLKVDENAKQETKNTEEKAEEAGSASEKVNDANSEEKTDAIPETGEEVPKENADAFTEAEDGRSNKETDDADPVTKKDGNLEKEATPEREETNANPEVFTNADEQADANSEEEAEADPQEEMEADSQEETEVDPEEDAEADPEEVEADSQEGMEVDLEEEGDAEQEEEADADPEGEGNANQEGEGDGNQDEEPDANHEEETDTNHEEEPDANHEEEVNASPEEYNTAFRNAEMVDQQVVENGLKSTNGDSYLNV